MTGPVRANNGEVLIQAAIEGQGLAYERFLTAAALADGRLVEVTLDVPFLKLGGIYAVAHPARRPAAKTRAWIDFLADRLGAVASDW